MLICICRFGTFIYNNDKERHDKSVVVNTLSLWAHIIAERGKMLNPQYHLLKEVLRTFNVCAPWLDRECDVYVDCVCVCVCVS